jgi:hypothetical protein
MAGGNKTERFPECVVLSVQQVTGKFTPRIPNYHGEEVVYSPYGPNVIDLHSGVYLRKKDRSGGTSWTNTVEIRNPGQKRIEIVTDPIGGQIISPFPNFYPIYQKNTFFSNDIIHINENITVDIGWHGHYLLISSKKINTQCELRVYEHNSSQVPIACARLDFVSDKKAEKIIKKHREHQESIHKYLRKKGWIDTK